MEFQCPLGIQAKVLASAAYKLFHDSVSRPVNEFEMIEMTGVAKDYQAYENCRNVMICI